MKKSVKVAVAASALALAGGLFLAGSGLAQGMFGGFGGPGGRMGPMGGFGEMRRELLASVDTNHDGKITQDEINAAINAKFAEFDADKNGSLSLTEFEALWADLTRPMAIRTFQFLDPNGDAQVSKAEIDARFGDIVNHLDRNHDGVLSAADRPGPDGRPGPWQHGPRHHHMWWNQGPGGQGPSDQGPGDQGPDDGSGNQ